MTVESGTYISDFDATNPPGSAAFSEGDDHLRWIKSAIKATFPNINAPVTVTPTELNYLSGVTSSVLHTNSLAALPAAIGTTTPVAGAFTTLTSNGTQVVVETRTITAGNGLTGGGALSADLTLTVGAGTGITVTSTAVALDTADSRNVDHGAVSITGTGLLTGGGTIAASRSIDLSAETVQDTVGAMFSGNTETNITATYQDTDGTIDLVVSAASTTAQGAVELATSAEVLAGTDINRAMTPSHFAANKSLGTSGYYSFPGGFTLQWGYATNVANGGTITFPTAFTSAYNVQATWVNAVVSGGEDEIAISGLTTTGFVIHHRDMGGSAADFYWFAIGVR